MPKTGRNEPCPCGSGKKYKKCCLLKASSDTSSFTLQKMRRTEGLLIDKIITFAEQQYDIIVLDLAWQEYNLWQERPLVERDELGEHEELEFETTFIPWFVFNWILSDEVSENSTECEPLSLAMLYLQSNKSKLEPFSRRFIEEICLQPYSFFVVEQVEPGKRLLLRDIFLQQTIWVLERQASISLDEGIILFSRVMSMDEVSIIVGCAPIVIPPLYFVDIQQVRERIIEKTGDIDKACLLDIDKMLRQLYFEIRDEVLQPNIPELCNSDGDPFELVELRYELKCTPGEAFQALKTLCSGNEADLISQARYNSKGEMVSVNFSWYKQANRKTVGIDNVVMGQIIIDENALRIEINSHQRSEEIQRKLRRRLGRRIVYKTAVIQSMQKMLQDLPNDPVQMSGERELAPFSAMSELPELAEFKQRYYDDYWETWYTTPIPALNNQTPNEASQTPQGRELLLALLRQYEQSHKQNPENDFLYTDLDSVRSKLNL